MVILFQNHFLVPIIPRLPNLMSD